MKRVDRLWIRLLLVQKCQIQKHQQRTLQNIKEKHEKSTYQRTRIQTQICQTHRQTTLVRPKTEMVNTEDTIRRRIIRTQETGPYQIMLKVNKNSLTTAYKSNALKFKLDEDPLQRQINFLTFMESLEMIFLQYKETWGVLID